MWKSPWLTVHTPPVIPANTTTTTLEAVWAVCAGIWPDAVALPGSVEVFDKAVLAVPADVARNILAAGGTSPPIEQAILSLVQYDPAVEITLHTDESYLPKNKAHWREFNYRADMSPEGFVDTFEVPHPAISPNCGHCLPPHTPTPTSIHPPARS